MLNPSFWKDYLQKRYADGSLPNFGSFIAVSLACFVLYEKLTMTHFLTKTGFNPPDRAAVRVKEGRFDDAIAYANIDLSKDLQVSNALVERGNAYLGKHDYVQALRDYEQVLLMTPRDAFAPADLCVTYQRQHHYKDADIVCRKNW